MGFGGEARMLKVEYARYYLPPGPGRRAPYASGWKMTAEEAKARGAVDQVPGTAEIRMEPETEDEKRRAQVEYQSAGHDSVKPPQK